MENISDNFSQFLRFSSQLIQKCRLAQISSQETLPLNFIQSSNNLPQNDNKNQLFVMEFYLSDSKTDSHYLIEQWIFNFHIDKLPQRLVKIVKNEKDMKIAFVSIIKTISSLLVNLPLYKEFLNKNSKYSSQLSHDFMLSHKIIQKPSDISNFQGWNSIKWSQYYMKYPQEDELYFYISSLNTTYKFSFQLNYFKNLFDLYKVLDPMKQNNRIRSISEQINNEISQKKRNIILNDNMGSNEFIQWKSKNSLLLNESIEDNFMSSFISQKSANIMKIDLSPKPRRESIVELSPHNGTINQSIKAYTSIFREILEENNKINGRNGNLKDDWKIEGAFININGKSDILEENKQIKSKGNSYDDDSLGAFIEGIEEKKKKIKCNNYHQNTENQTSRKNIKDLLDELKKFSEKIDN